MTTRVEDYTWLKVIPTGLDRDMVLCPLSRLDLKELLVVPLHVENSCWMGPLPTLYVALSVAVGRLIHAFARKPYRVVRMRRADQIYGHHGRPVSRLLEGLQHIYHLSCVVLLLYEAREGYAQDKIQKTRKGYHATPSLISLTFLLRLDSRPVNVVSGQLNNVNIRTWMETHE